jgi:hypothetical protein
VPDQDAAGRRRRVRGDDVAAVRDEERPPPRRAVGRQVGGRERPAGLVLVGDDRPGQLARVQILGPLRQPRDRGGQIGLTDRRALADQLTSGPEDRAHLGRVPQDLADRDQHGVLPARAADAAGGRLGGGQEQLGPRHRSEPAVDGIEAREDAGDGARRRPDVELLGRLLVEGHEHALDLRQPAAGGQVEPRDCGERVDQAGGAARRPHHQEAAAARAGEARLGRPGHRAGGDDGVERVPAALQHVRARPGGDRVAGCDRCSHGASLGRVR